MKTLKKQPIATLALGVILGISFIALKPYQPVKASAANGNDKFSMCTCRVASGESEAVFVLDHLTGVLSGGFLNSQSNSFSHRYLRTVSQDFQLNPATPEPKYSMVSGDAQLRTSGGLQPAKRADLRRGTHVWSDHRIRICSAAGTRSLNPTGNLSHRRLSVP